MKLIHCADIHIGVESYGRLDPETGLSTRLGDFLAALDRIVDYAITNKIDLFLFAGDAYKNREPTPTHQREFSKRILKLARSGIQCVLLVGNHDTSLAPGKANSLDIYSTLEVEGVNVIRHPELIEVAGLQIIGIPWLRKDSYENLHETLNSLYQKLDPNKPAIITLHGTVEGSVFGSERNVMLGKDYVIPKGLLLNQKIAYVACGHIHKRQVLGTNPPIVYSGSIERVDFGEAEEEKSFELVAISDQREAEHKPISTNARKFVYLNFDIEDKQSFPTRVVLDEIKKHEIKDAVVKVVLNCSDVKASEIDLSEIKASLKDAFFLAGVAKNITRTERLKLEGGFVIETLSPMTALEKYLKAKSYPESKINLLKKYAKELTKD
ncbi:MAG: hypothetical protein A2Y57_02600 [Candidatus Woykebacteria bacterium RBG_13_40_7b]|uniref:Nuclease SbcCD subunit D n=1 Tax=Candidatus Woykebacteria bacterium RBG_13_40_7b TaxID=1802594 RepID=A0A1G1WCL1_9BACT|nr:MAG: hypothetical protein A2Y57_02600 [Candidatus Woykebacteria bacterium RBG_13_40_7b]